MTSSVTYIGVRHHSPACARLVARTVARLRPAYVLIEGPAEMNARMSELYLRHRLPIAVFSSGPGFSSYAPFCAYSPEWAALTAARAAESVPLFIDLPAWHPAFRHRSNRYADAEKHYAAAVQRLCRELRASNSDELWDRMFEVEEQDGLEERLTAYFDLLRGDLDAGEGDAARERYMARWISAAAAKAGDAGVVVVTGGFHTSALRRLVAAEPAESADPATLDLTADGWPEVPAGADGEGVSSYLVPYSFRRLDAFTGYQSGMPSPEYYQLLWEHGPERAAQEVTTAVARRLRARGLPASTADLIAARTQAEGLARLRGSSVPTRVDLLDGLVSALVSEDLGRPVPWGGHGGLTPGAHPVVVEMVDSISGARVGRLHAQTPAPPLVHDALARLERLGLDRVGELDLDLTDPGGLERSRVLHQLRVLGIPGAARESGPANGLDPASRERWRLARVERRLAALIEAGAHGATLEQAAATVLAERMAGRDGADVLPLLAAVLFDTVLCGLLAAADQVLARIVDALADSAAGTGPGANLGELGAVLAAALGLWRHDRVFQVSRSPGLTHVIAAAAERLLQLAEAVTGPDAPTDPARSAALAALRDAVWHAESVLTLDRAAVIAAAARMAGDQHIPPDLRGAALGLGWSLGAVPEPGRGVIPPGLGVRRLGDWLAGLFVLAREQASGPEMIGLLDAVVTGMAQEEFLAALPALRMAFAYFPPREKQGVAQALLDRRGLRGDARGLLRTVVSPEEFARVRAGEQAALAELVEAGLLSARAQQIVAGAGI
ncbi:hypothetical protein KDL01_39745 [Actinospica durhamensis]|uniref:Uncharacterized protein n=1 Tax=Actinospica durhamensis TaxID=1508375 RepID=A0A941EY86_9ACTN|nr:DUF5682 family protein [Actinospica durhamensis]MBR7839461.1 hypothetical protein [Actinospica durhamensis]